MTDYSPWIGKARRSVRRLDRSDLARMAAVLDVDVVPDTVWPTWHWACFPDIAPQARLGHDGHPRRGEFLPPVTAPRRMFAAADMSVLAPLEAGKDTEIVETIASAETKVGRTGALTFIGLDRAFIQGGRPRLNERQTFVYREAETGPWRPPSPTPPDHAAQWSHARSADAVLLFRYSTATFNSHRIHYDRAYAMGDEGYPGLVVHGPLLATLLVESLRAEQPARVLTRFAFQARRPIFDGQTFHVCGRVDGDVAQLWITADDGGVAMTARADLAPSA